MDQLHALLFVLGQNYSQACEEVRGRFLLSHDGVEVSVGSRVGMQIRNSILDLSLVHST